MMRIFEEPVTGGISSQWMIFFMMRTSSFSDGSQNYLQHPMPFLDETFVCQGFCMHGVI
jgi:hypothetical protein